MTTKKLKQFLRNYQILSYLQGIPITNYITPKYHSQSGFLIFHAKKSNKELLLKILYQPKFFSRLESEIFFYKTFSSLTRVKKFIPQLFNFSKNPPGFLEIEYLKNYYPLGSFHQISHHLDSQLLKKILSVINLFHNKNNLVNLKKQKYIIPKRTDQFYLNKLINLDTGERINNYFNTDPNKIIKLIRICAKNLAEAEYFVLGDRNPSNILIKDATIKLIDFDHFSYLSSTTVGVNRFS